MPSQHDPGRAAGQGPSRPGTPSLLRELNDRAALELLLDGRAMTRSQLSELTGVSKVTVAQMLGRLEERGLVAAVGEQSVGRGPNAALYSVVASSAYVAALYVEHGLVSTAVADVTGRVIAEARDDTNGDGDPVELVRSAVDRACRRAGVSISMLSAFVIGSPGVVDPVSGDPQFSFNLPAWHAGVLAALRGTLHKNVLIENDVNLAAMAEHAIGAAAGAEDFVLMWLGTGVGLATVLGGRLYRGVSGAAGEIGWLPVPGAPVTSDVNYPAGGGLQWLAGGEAIGALAAEFGFAGSGQPGPGGWTPAESVSAAVAAHSVIAAAAPGAGAAPAAAPGADAAPAAAPGAATGAAPGAAPGAATGAAPGAGAALGAATGATPGAGAAPGAATGAALGAAPGAGAPRPDSAAGRAGQFLDELARRVALGAVAVCTVIDPGLVVLGGEIGLAGGTALAGRVAAEVSRICPVRPRVLPTAVPSEPVLRGALLTAVQQARADLLASVAG
jgi:predicted NBD/HSP70 family sugar kinase